MAIENFIPEVWAAGVQKAFVQSQLIIPTLTTTFSGEAGRGNTVNIIGAVTPTIVDYKAAGRTINPEALADTEVQLLIDQEAAFSVNVDDVDVVQAGNDFSAWVASAGEALMEDSESYVIGKMLAEGTNANAGAAVIATDADAKAALRSLRTALTKTKVPAANRFVAVNPAFADLLVAGLSDASTAGTDAELRNGVVGRLYGLTVIETPLFAEDTKPVAVAYHSSTIGYVNQIDKVESLRNQTKFADIVRGLNVYGAKVIRPEAVLTFVSA